MIQVSIVRCPQCGDSWLNKEYTRFFCKCGKCQSIYVRENNTVQSYRFVFEAIKRTKGE